MKTSLKNKILKKLEKEEFFYTVFVYKTANSLIVKEYDSLAILLNDNNIDDIYVVDYANSRYTVKSKPSIITDFKPNKVYQFVYKNKTYTDNNLEDIVKKYRKITDTFIYYLDKAAVLKLLKSKNKRDKEVLNLIISSFTKKWN